MRTRILLRCALAGAAAIAGCSRSATVETAPAPAPTPTVTRPTYSTGRDVIAAMRARYDGKWYSTIRFTQATSRLGPDDKWKVDTWYEAGHFPGRLRIDFDPLKDGNGVIYAHDSAFTVRNGKPLPGAPGINDLLVLGFDVYFSTPARTEALLAKEGFNLDRVHMSTFEGRPMIVVGARAGDTHSKQFWVDAERLYFVRILQPTVRDSTKVQDIRFVNYRAEGSAWVAPRVEIRTDGKLTFHEDYTDVKVNVPLDEALFDPSKWKTARHWKS
jgi:hypothetical protein